MKHLVLVLLIGLSIQVFSQKTSDLYMPKEIKQSYDKGTRTYDGTAGKNYFVTKPQ